jgi:hypothetical protein
MFHMYTSDATRRHLAKVGEYQMKKGHRYKSKACMIPEILSVNFDNLSADFKKYW